ncbi:MAG: phosphatase PAP2 family protein [Bacteroidota bacterium]
MKITACLLLIVLYLLPGTDMSQAGNPLLFNLLEEDRRKFLRNEWQPQKPLRGLTLHLKSSLFTDEITTSGEDSSPRFTIDDLLQYTPAAAVYALNLAGIRGKHRFVDRTLLLAGSYVLMGSTVYSLKRITHVQRPDGTTFDSFPSGHTAIAFMGAEFLRLEYRHRSPWYGVAGYVVATTTAGLRVHHKRHYVTDVLAGAVIGVAATQVAYAVYPWVGQWLFPGKESKQETSLYFAPVLTCQGAGIAVGGRF